MTTTVISTDTTDTVFLDGDDTVIVTSDGSITEGNRGIDTDGDNNVISIFGDVFATGFNSAIFVDGGIGHSITIGEDALIYSQATGNGGVYFGGVGQILNHGSLYGELTVLLRGGSSTLTNTGLISSNAEPGLNTFGSAVLLMSTDNYLNNSGSIISSDSGIQGWRESSGGTHTIINTGEIAGDVALNFDYYTIGSSVIVNGGTMTGTSGVALNFEIELALSNSGDVFGDIVSLAHDDVVKNSGDILGDVSLGEGADLLRNSGLIEGDVDGAGGNDAVKNDGMINGMVETGGDADMVINSGTINGDVDLGAGADKYLAKGDGGLEAGHAVYGGGGDDTIVGGSLSDTLFGEGNNDTIKGGWGDDFVFGGDGNDTLKGGAGDDEIFGEGDNDTIYGGLGDDLIDGGLNSDTIDGGKGDDTIIGGNGSDVLIGGKDDDTLTGGNGGDTFVLSRHDGNDVITDFADGSDLIDFSVFGMGSKAAVQAAISQVDAGLMVDLSVYGGSGTVLIEGMLLADFSGQDFVY